MKYTIAFAAAVAVARAAMMAPIPDAAQTSTAYVTDEVTVISCGPEVTNCPARSSTAAPAMSTTAMVVPPVMTTPVATSVPAMSSAPAPAPPAPAPAMSSQAPPAPPAPAPAMSSQAPPAPPAPVMSSQAAATCVPTTVYSTITVTMAAPQSTTPVATMAPFPTGSGSQGSAAPSGTAPASGVASGTGVGFQPTSSPITPSNGAAGLSASFGGIALAAAAAILFA